MLQENTQTRILLPLKKRKHLSFQIILLLKHLSKNTFGSLKIESYLIKHLNQVLVNSYMIMQ